MMRGDATSAVVMVMIVMVMMVFTVMMAMASSHQPHADECLGILLFPTSPAWQARRCTKTVVVIVTMVVIRWW